MDYTTLILTIAKQIKISGPLLLAICTHETGLHNIIVENDGGTPTVGICMMKAETAKMLGYKGSWYGLMDPAINALWAARYIKYQEKRYGEDYCKIVASYNAGSYVESKITPGMPRNLKYVRMVQSKLDDSLKDRLSCGELAQE